jgi:hypothetical protein
MSAEGDCHRAIRAVSRSTPRCFHTGVARRRLVCSACDGDLFQPEARPGGGRVEIDSQHREERIAWALSRRGDLWQRSRGKTVDGAHGDTDRRGGPRRAAIRPEEPRGGRRRGDGSSLRQKGSDDARKGGGTRFPRRTAIAQPPWSISPERCWRDRSAAAESPHCRQSGRWFRPKPTPWRTSFCDARRLDFPRDRYPSARTLLICLTVVWYYCPTLCGKISQQ